MKKTRMEKGITLIALIITIVVLLILAIVSIGAIKNSSIITHAQNASDDYTKAQEKEQLQLAVSEWQIQKSMNNGASLKSVIEEELKDSNVTIKENEDETIEVTFNKTGNIYIVNSDGTITGSEGGNGGSGSETEMPVATVGTPVEKNSTINGKKYSSDNPVIPAGFKAINVTTEGHESYWDAEGGPQVSEGLVISDGNSEFVWIPVTSEITSFGLNTEGYREPDVITGVTPSADTDSASGEEYDAVPSNLEKAGFAEDLNSDGEVDAYDFKIELENNFSKMAESVAEYGGFYVGRYETSMNGSTAQSKAGEMPMNNATWYTMYTNSKTYSTSGVISEMIWGCQWDAMMDFIGSEEASKKGRVSRNLSSVYLTGNGQGEGQYPGTITYSDIINNIYDLEGNVCEWTQEAKKDRYRILHGGSFYNTPPSLEIDWYPDSESNYYGSRLTLYVEM